MQQFAGRVAVVTGAASGIGRALAERFAAEKMQLVLSDIDDEGLSAACKELSGEGATVVSRRVDVSHAADADALAEHAYSSYGAVHVLCNNAGVGGLGGVTWQQSLDAWRWVIDVNLFGVIHGIRSFVPRMVAATDEAHVVNTASLAGLMTGPMIAPYTVSKHGVVALSEVLYHDLQVAKAAHVGVSVLCPGFVNTRIADSLRNCPFPTQGSDEMRNQLQRMLEEYGMPPASVADQVVAAIRDKRFWILTHPQHNGLIRERMERLLEQENPKMPLPPQPPREAAG